MEPIKLNKGKIEKIIFSGKNGFVIMHIFVPAFNRTITAKGICFGADVSRYVNGTLYPDTDSKYGLQFEIKNASIDVSGDKESVIKFLSCGLFRGVGHATAENIWNALKDSTLSTIKSKNVERIAAIKGVGKEKAKKIIKDYESNQVYEQLSQYNLTPSQIKKIYDFYGVDSISIIEKNPYQLIYSIDGMGFKTVDRIALKNGFSASDPRRFAAALQYKLLSIREDGHCFCHIDNLEDMVKEMIPDISTEQLADVILKEIEEKRIWLDEYRVYSKMLYQAENNTAQYLARLLKQQKTSSLTQPSEAHIKMAIKATERNNGFELGQDQVNAIKTALTNRVSVITGGPGCGKTTIIRAITYAWKKGVNENIILCAPTGKAARRMSDATGFPAKTIHFIIYGPDLAVENPLFVCDEASMLDLPLAEQLLNIVVAHNGTLVMVGDADQLPPIGAGHFFLDCIESPLIPTAKLTMSHRFAGSIARNAEHINRGEGFHSFMFDQNTEFIPAKKTQVADIIVNKFKELLTKYNVSDISVVVPMRKKSSSAADILNERIRESVNPLKKGEKTFGKQNFRKGDRVMNCQNDYENEIYNGECGTVTEITDFIMTVSYDNEREIEYRPRDVDSLTFAYALTVHKMQGSENKVCILAFSNEHSIMLQRNLLYTAITRAKEKVIIIGESQAINMAISKIGSLERNTILKQRIKNAYFGNSNP